VTNEGTPGLEFLPADLRKEIEAIAAEEGRGAEAVVAAGARRYLWDTIFRKLRKNAQQRARIQGIVSDEAVLTTVLVVRRPDEYSLQKPAEPTVAVDDVEDEVVEEATSSSSSRREPRPTRETRETPREANGGRVRQDSAPSPGAETSGRRRRSRGGRGRGERTGERREIAVASSADTAPVPTPRVAVEALRRRSESVHRFLPPELDSGADEPAAPTIAEEQIPHTTSHRHEPPSPPRDSEPSWQSSPPRSRDDRQSPRSWETERPAPPDEESSLAPIGSREAPAPRVDAEATQAATYGRRPRRNARRG